MKDPKLHKALSNLSLALAERDREGSSPINDAGVSKCFEVALEYFWKFLKRVIEDSGLEATSPKDTIKVGASIGMVKNPEKWIRYINWFLDCLGRAISNAESTLCAVLFKAQLWNKINQNSVNERQRLIINRMLDSTFIGHMNTAKYAKLAKCSNDTALRDIQELKAHGVLVQNESGGRSTSYRLQDSIE